VQFTEAQARWTNGYVVVVWFSIAAEPV